MTESKLQALSDSLTTNLVRIESLFADRFRVAAWVKLNEKELWFKKSGREWVLWVEGLGTGKELINCSLWERRGAAVKLRELFFALVAAERETVVGLADAVSCTDALASEIEAGQVKE